MALTENPFQNLYDYSGDTGTVIPQTSDIKQMVVSAFNTIFGASVSTDDETPMGRFIEALTMLIINVLGVNAQNANMLNPRLAAGNALLLVDHVNAGLGVLSDGLVLTDLHALAALDADIGLCCVALCNNTDAGQILVKFLIECLGAGLNTLQTGHAGLIFLNGELLHIRILLCIIYRNYYIDK